MSAHELRLLCTKEPDSLQSPIALGQSRLLEWSDHPINETSQSTKRELQSSEERMCHNSNKMIQFHQSKQIIPVGMLSHKQVEPMLEEWDY